MPVVGPIEIILSVGLCFVQNLLEANRFVSTGSDYSLAFSVLGTHGFIMENQHTFLYACAV